MSRFRLVLVLTGLLGLMSCAPRSGLRNLPKGGLQIQQPSIGASRVAVMRLPVPALCLEIQLQTTGLLGEPLRQSLALELAKCLQARYAPLQVSSAVLPDAIALQAYGSPKRVVPLLRDWLGTLPRLADSLRVAGLPAFRFDGLSPLDYAAYLGQQAVFADHLYGHSLTPQQRRVSLRQRVLGLFTQTRATWALVGNLPPDSQLIPLLQPLATWPVGEPLEKLEAIPLEVHAVGFHAQDWAEDALAVFWGMSALGEKQLPAALVANEWLLAREQVLLCNRKNLSCTLEEASGWAPHPLGGLRFKATATAPAVTNFLQEAENLSQQAISPKALQEAKQAVRTAWLATLLTPTTGARQLGIWVRAGAADQLAYLPDAIEAVDAQDVTKAAQTQFMAFNWTLAGRTRKVGRGIFFP